MASASQNQNASTNEVTPASVATPRRRFGCSAVQSTNGLVVRSGVRAGAWPPGKIEVGPIKA